MNRRSFLKRCSGLAICVAVTGDVFSADIKKPAKPNILFIISDDLCTALSGFGHKQCKTPNLDKLASRGVRFDRAYCNWPVCGPSRASLMTGLYPPALKLKGNSSKFRPTAPDLVTMSQLFKNNGYYAARVSKIYHMGIPGEIMAGTAKHDDAASWNHVVNITAPEQYSKGEREDLSPGVTHQGMDFQTVRLIDDSKQADKQAVDQAIKILKGCKDKPFFMGVGLVRPHVPLVAPADLFEQYPPDQMKLPYVPDGDLDDIPEIAKRNSNSNKYKMSKDQQHKTLQAYYASVTYMDQQVGRLLDAIKELALNDNTIIVFTSDHGYNLGQHTYWQKQSLFEDTLRVPLIITAPWLNTEGQRTKQIVELIDIYPTLADLAGLKAPDYLHGKSLKPLLLNPKTSKWQPKPAYTTTVWQGKSLTTDRWRLNTWSDGQKGIELYDQQNDPEEFTNLANKSEYKGVLEKLKKQLSAIDDKSKSIVKK
ncbi:MAG: sulfatase [Anaerohalosphaera sp.]|nr:sulfatase [Anaerohalosphaera sp.]